MNSNIKVKRIFEVILVVFIHIIINLNILGCCGCCGKKRFSPDASTHDGLISKLPTAIQGKKFKPKEEVVKGNSEESYSSEENNEDMPNNSDIPSKENNFQEKELINELDNVNESDNVEDQDLELIIYEKDLLNMNNQGKKFFGPIEEANEEEEVEKENEEEEEAKKEENNTNNEINSNNDDKNKFKCVKTLTGHKDMIVSLIELESGKLVSGSYDKTIRICDINDKIGNEQVINETKEILCLLEFEKNKILSGIKANSINLWDLEDPGQEKFSFEGHTAWVNALVKCDSKCFASASNDNTIKIWDYYKRKCISTLTGHKDCVISLILLKNENLCSGSADSTIRIWDWRSGKCISVLSEVDGGWIRCIMELDNNVLVTGSNVHNNIILWKNGSKFKALEGHTNHVRTFCQINKKYFASGSFDHTIKIWEINSWECVQTLNDHKLSVICLISLKHQNQNDNEDNGCNQLIASCSNDNTIKIWKNNYLIN